MQEKWLAYQSFQQGQDVLEAVNSLLINLKLNRTQLPEVEPQVTKTRMEIAEFLGQLDKMVRASKAERAILGADSRLRDLAISLSTSQQGTVVPEPFKAAPLADALRRFAPDQFPTIIDGLSQLRRIIERHIQEDALQVLGEL